MELFAAANRIRHHFVGDVAHICSIVNAKSGSCSEDCSFCAQSAHFKTDSPEYPLMSSEQILASAKASAEVGSKKFGIVISGRELKQGEELDQLWDPCSWDELHSMGPELDRAITEFNAEVNER